MTANENKTNLGSYGDSGGGDFPGFLGFYSRTPMFYPRAPRLFPRASRGFVLGLLGVNLGFLDFNSVAS